MDISRIFSESFLDGLTIVIYGYLNVSSWLWG